MVSCLVHVKCLLQCHLHSFPFPFYSTDVNMQSEPGSLNQIYQDRCSCPPKLDRMVVVIKPAGERETGNFAEFQRVIFIFDRIYHFHSVPSRSLQIDTLTTYN